MGNSNSLSCMKGKRLSKTGNITNPDQLNEKVVFIQKKKEKKSNEKDGCNSKDTDRNNNIIDRGARRIFNRKKQNNKVHSDTTKNNKNDSFIIHGIDYLPEAMKRKERRKKNVPKFLEHPSFPSVFSIFQNHDHRSHNSASCFVKSHSFNGTKRAIEHHKDIVEPSNNKLRSSTPSIVSLSGEEWKSFQNFPFRNLVMSGGGSKGYAYIGSLKALEDCGLLKGFRKMAGSSAGAICAGLLAVGCTPQEIADVFKCDIKWLFHDQECMCCCLPGMYSQYGVHPAKRFHKIYGQHLRKKAGSADITFKQVYEEKGVELCVVVTNLSRMCSEYCNRNTAPDLPIRDAVRMSMSFPVMYTAIRSTISGRECLYTDGGLLDQFPISYYDDTNGLTAKKRVYDDEENDNDDFDDDDDIRECLVQNDSLISPESLTHADDNASIKNDGKHIGRETADKVGEQAEKVESGKSQLNYETLGLYVVSERPVDHKIWRALFDCHIPYRPTYLPNTKLARARLKNEMAIRKLHDKQFNKQEFMEDLAMTSDLRQHYELMHKSHVDIRSLSEYFMTAIEALLISQRKVRVRKEDRLRTVAINCGYIGTNDYQVEPGDREFMIDQGYSCTVKYLKEFIKANPVSKST